MFISISTKYLGLKVLGEIKLEHLQKTHRRIP